MITDVRTFLPGIGFRRAGMRLAAPVSVERGERTLTVRELVATPEATDLVYDVTCLPDDGAPSPPGSMDRVSLHNGSVEYGVGGWMRLWVRPGKLERGFTMVPLPSGLARVDLHVSAESIGEWSVPLDLVPFPADGDPRYAAVDASDARHDITVTVRGMVAGTEATAIDLIALADGPRVHVRGLGGLHGMRDASTALALHDQKGRTYTEQFRQDARDQFPNPTGIADVAMFETLPGDAEELVLEVPSVCFEDGEPTLGIDLPVAAPFDATFGPRQVRVLASRQVTTARGPQPPLPAIAIELDLGDVADEVCIIMPSLVKVDGQPGGYGFGAKGIHGPSPEPLKLIEIHQPGPEAPKRVTLVGAIVRARGPWRIRFACPRP